MGYAAVSIGLFLLIITYFTLNSPTKNDELPPTASEFCQLADPATALTFQAPADNVMKPGGIDGEITNKHDFSSVNTTYQLIRKNVPLSRRDVKGKKDNFVDSSQHFDKAEKLNINIPEIDANKFKVFFPQLSGEISLDRKLFSRTRGEDSNLMYFIDYGLVFLLYMNTDGTFTEYRGGTREGSSETFYLADIYRDIGSGRPELPAEAFQCDTTKGANLAGRQVVVPEQQESTSASQLQLEYFVFDGRGEVANGWGIHCKPALYLYPPKKQLVNVKVYPSGFLTYVDPPYDKEKGWTVWAQPSGKIEDLRFKIYDYLYFESKVPDQVIDKPTRGWVVKSESGIPPEARLAEGGMYHESWFNPLENHFNNILPQLGLNPQQTRDFIDYWKKALPESPYYFVGIIDQDNVNEIERLEITPKPDSINRVRVYFERLAQPKTVEEPSVVSNQQSAEDRKLKAESEFRVVEWGGMVKNDPNHPFTCSQ